MHRARTIVGTGVGALSVLCSLFAAGCGSKRRSWQEAEEIGTQQAYETFLSRHADGLYADSARDRIERLQFDAALGANTITGFEGFLAHHPGGPLADSAAKVLDTLYLARARDAGPLQEIVYWQRRGSPRVLSKSLKEVARRVYLSRRYVTIDATTGDTVSATTVGFPTVCLDENGKIVRDSFGPVGIKPFTAEIFTGPPGAQIGWSLLDEYEQPSQESSLLFGCANCVKETGITNCVYLW